jgi:hypothetical protein
MNETGQALIEIEGLTKVFYTDEIETHALSGIHLTDRPDAGNPRCFRFWVCSIHRQRGSIS